MTTGNLALPADCMDSWVLNQPEWGSQWMSFVPPGPFLVQEGSQLKPPVRAVYMSLKCRNQFLMDSWFVRVVHETLDPWCKESKWLKRVLKHYDSSWLLTGTSVCCIWEASSTQSVRNPVGFIPALGWIPGRPWRKAGQSSSCLAGQTQEATGEQGRSPFWSVHRAQMKETLILIGPHIQSKPIWGGTEGIIFRLFVFDLCV